MNKNDDLIFCWFEKSDRFKSSPEPLSQFQQN